NSNSSISKHYHQLTSVQRGQIQAMLDSGITSRTVIAQEVGCHKSTISREIKRGSVLQRDSSYLLYEHYYADTAQIYYEKRRKNCYQRNPLKHYAVFLRMLSRRFKAKFDATSSMSSLVNSKGLYQATLVPSHQPSIAILIRACWT
ncbi:MAG TPA: helix-turn-helix domain-containing protein, partial [Mammaliicoccus lentus]